MKITRRPLAPTHLFPLFLVLASSSLHGGLVGSQPGIEFDPTLCTGHGGPCSQTFLTPSGLTATYQNSINVPVGLGQFGQFAGALSGHATIGASVGASSSITLTNYAPETFSEEASDLGTVAALTSLWQDNLTIQGAPAGYNVIATVSLDGSITSPSEMFASSAVVEPFLCDVEASGPCAFDNLILDTGDPVPPSLTLLFAPVTDYISIGMEIAVVSSLGGIFDDEATTFPNVTGTTSAQFGSTATLTSILFVDAQGNPIPGISITSDSGAPFPLDPRNTQAAVPEPGTLCMVAGTLLAVASRRRRPSC